MAAKFNYKFRVIHKTEETVNVSAGSLDEAKEKIWQTEIGKYKHIDETIDLVCEGISTVKPNLRSMVS